MRRTRLLKALKIALIAAVALGVVGFLVMDLWNALIPSIFAVRTINFWQALGLLLLSKLLFGGLRPALAGGWGSRRRMVERWERMTPEERERFKQGMRGSCGPGRKAENVRTEAEVGA